MRAASLALLACLAASPPGAAAPSDRDLREPGAPREPPAPAPRPVPRLTASMSSGTARLGDLVMQLELGRWTAGELDRLLRGAHARHTDPSARLAYLAEHFRGTPFEYESLSPLPPPGALRVRLDRFGCTGFVISMLALAGAQSFEDFARNLARIRYWRATPSTLDSDPTTGNILDFAWEVFIDSAVGQGFATDVTADIARGTPLTRFRARFTARQRGRIYDPDERLVISRVHPDRTVTALMLSQPDLAALGRAGRARVKSGDILLFTRIDFRRPPGEELLIGHAAVAANIDGELYMVHATRDYVWRPYAGHDTKPLATGIYYGDPRREQLGVALATAWTGDRRGQELRLDDGVALHGYDRTQLRPVHEYMAGARFHGVMVLRPASTPATR